MAIKRTRTLATWGLVVLSCALGCATGTQSEGLLADPIDTGGSGGSAGTTSETAGLSNAAAGTDATSGSSGASLAGFTSGGDLASGGTFGMGGTAGSSGTAGMAGAGAPTGGAAGASGSGGAASGAGGKAGSGGAAGAGGKAGNPCGSTKLTIASATGTQENTSLSPSFAIDGSMATRWASEKSAPQTLDLDLGEVVTVSRVLINWEAAYATNYELQIATNAAGPFTTIYMDTAGNGGTDDVTTLNVSDGRYLRMHGITRKTAYGFSIYEIAVYGDKDETCH